MLACLPTDTPLYLVGGAVRDVLRKRPLHDIDLALPGQALPVARRIADALGMAFYPLDEERDTARLILRRENDERLVFDITTLRGADIQADLLARDFTINAIALDLRYPDRLVDPLGGASDLHAGRLRLCAPYSLQSDPVRVMRAVRMAFTFNLKIDPETRSAIRLAAPQLPRVSAERIRDELFRMLDGVHVASSIRMLDLLGIMPYVLPELENLKGIEQSPPHVYDVWEHTLEVAARLQVVLDVLKPVYDSDAGGNLAAGLISVRLGRYRAQIAEHINYAFNPDRTARPLLFLAALYHDIAKPHTRQLDAAGRARFFQHDEQGAHILSQRAHSLRLSTVEIDRAKTIVRHHMRPMLLAQENHPPTRRAIYRFFRTTQAAGVDICLLSLADFLGTYAVVLPQDLWSHHLDVLRSLLEAWWEMPQEVISPPALLNGHQIIQQFGVAPGPQIGHLLEAVREAQATGEVASVEQALDLIRQLLESGESLA
jgi:putative nucleotidyltransferase with HDIG domain